MIVNIASDKSKSTIGFITNNVNMLVPTQVTSDAAGSGLAVACLTAVREVLGSNRAVGNCFYRKTTAIYSLGHGLCAPFLQCLGQLSLLPSVGW